MQTVSMNKLSMLIDQLEQHIAKQTLIDTSVSQSPVGWHIEHSLLTLNSIVEALKKSEPASYKWKFSFPKILVFTMNKIPRGRGKAPTWVLPKETYSTESLKAHIISSRQKLLELEKLPLNNYIRHPVFGNLRLKPTLKFLAIHTQHHLNIIKDILKK